MKCKYCGAEINERSNFCRKCGRGLDGQINPSEKNDMKKQMQNEIKSVLKKFDRSTDKNEWDESLCQYEINREKLNELPLPISPPKTIMLIVTAITVAIFSILIPGLNIENENFHWIVSDSRTALFFCSSFGLMPSYLIGCIVECIYTKNWEEFGFFRIVVSVIIGAVGSIPLVFILFFFKGFFGTGFKTFVIAATIALGLFAIINVIRFIANGQIRSDYFFRVFRLKQEEENYLKKMDEAIDKVKERYKEYFSEKELDSIAFNARTETFRKQ